MLDMLPRDRCLQPRQRQILFRATQKTGAAYHSLGPHRGPRHGISFRHLETAKTVDHYWCLSTNLSSENSGSRAGGLGMLQKVAHGRPSLVQCNIHG